MSTTTVAADAFASFHSGDHTRCGQLLEQITTSKGSYDLKAAHNLHLNTYFTTNCADPDTLLKSLSQAQQKVSERDKKEKGRKKKDEDEDDAKDEDFSILKYNQAVLSMQLRNYAQATLLLQELFDNIEPIDDFLAIKICFLLLELHLIQRDPEEALPVLQHLEKPNAFLTLLGGGRSSKMLDTRVGDDSAAAAAAGEGDESRSAEKALESAGETGTGAGVARAADGAASEAPEGPLPSLVMGSFLSRHGRAPDTISRHEYKFYCTMYRARLQSLLKNPKGAKKDVKAAMEIFETELRHAPLMTTLKSMQSSASTPEKLLREAVNQHQSAVVCERKAYLEYSKQNLKKAMRLMTLCSFNFARKGTSEDSKNQSGRRPRHGTEDDEAPSDWNPAMDADCAPLFYNNLGCCSFMMQKPNLALIYYNKALAVKPYEGVHLTAKACTVKPGLMATRHWLDRREETFYNAGLQHLMCERPIIAFKFFYNCIPVFRTWPRLWLRLAECCIELHRQKAEKSSGETASGSQAWDPAVSRIHGPGQSSVFDLGAAERRLLWGVEGWGPHRRWLLTTQKKPMVGRYAPAAAPGAAAAAAAGDDDAAGAGASEAAAGDADLPECLRGNRELTYAKMCLLNVIVQTDKKPQSSKSGAGADGIADSVVAGSAANGAGAAVDKASAKAKAGDSKDGKDGKAGDKDKDKDKDKAATLPPPANSKGGQGRDVLEVENSLLEDCGLVKMAYVCLCQNDYSAAIRYSRQLLEKNHVVPKEEEGKEGKKHWQFQAAPFLQAYSTLGFGKETGPPTPGPAKFPASVGCIMTAVFYAAEALLMSGKCTEAKSLLGSFVQGNNTQKGAELQSTALQEFDRLLSVQVSPSPAYMSKEPEVADDAAATAACNGHKPSTGLGGMTSAMYVLHCAGGPGALQAVRSKDTKGESKADAGDKEKGAKENSQAAMVCFPPTEFPRLGDAQSMLLTNMAAVQIQENNLREAERICERALQAQPKALAPLRTLLYILLRRGKQKEALQRLKQGRMRPANAGSSGPSAAAPAA
eukprot:TRINITY_DN12793_c0_g1_i2.p1 TRINITY_DN12793_c0_g1~~TRINITY_DN12793_c0_g1_i2.p1  ORF type:complete len:1041 (+),score=272.00 TRINITY_DN12793_c0_g1_i2:120-3242(+)